VSFLLTLAIFVFIFSPLMFSPVAGFATLPFQPLLILPLAFSAFSLFSFSFSVFVITLRFRLLPTGFHFTRFVFHHFRRQFFAWFHADACQLSMIFRRPSIAILRFHHDYRH